VCCARTGAVASKACRVLWATVCCVLCIVQVLASSRQIKQAGPHLKISLISASSEEIFPIDSLAKVCHSCSRHEV
jgi:hypothetical protein